MYSVSAFGWMINDSVRMAAYEQALRQAIRPDSVVLDIGAGTGIFSLLACQLGARHVYAIEPNDAIQVAREVAAANGFQARITCMQALSTQASLPEPVDVIVSDLRGILPLLGGHIPAIIDARARFLKPGGTLIARRDTLWAAVVSAEELYRPCVAPWIENPYGLDMRAGRAIVVNAWRKARVKPEQVLCPPQQWAALDYPTITTPDVAGTLRWTVERAGTGHGLAVWFDAELLEGITFSNGPEHPELVYGMGFFPWEAAVALAPGDTITARLEADLVGDEYIWRWATQVRGAGGAPLKADFAQSTFFGMPLTPGSMRKRADGFAPTLTEDGEIDRLILSLMGEGLTLRAIAERVAARFGTRFPSWQAALPRVSKLSEKYAR